MWVFAALSFLDFAPCNGGAVGGHVDHPYMRASRPSIFHELTTCHTPQTQMSFQDYQQVLGATLDWNYLRKTNSQAAELVGSHELQWWINQSMVTSACPSLDLHYFGEDSTISPYFLSHRSIRQSGRKHWKKIQIYEAKSYARLMMIRWECKISSLVSTALPWAVLHCLLPLPSSFAWLHA